jgi:hypothetical protein
MNDKRNHRRWTGAASVWALALLLLIASPAVVRAVTFQIKPMVTVSGRYDTNFYRGDRIEREVWTYLAAPGIHLGMEAPRLKIELDYTLEAYFYDEVGDPPAGERVANKESYLGHLISLATRYDITPRIQLSLKDALYKTRDSGYTDQFDTSFNRELYWINRLTPGVFYDFENKFQAGLRYRRTDIDYIDDDSVDSHENRGIFNLIYNPNRSSTLDLELQYWDTEYDSGFSGYTAAQGKLIFEKRYKYTAFNIGVGWQGRDFDESGVSSADTLAWKASVTWQNPAPPEITRRIGEFYLRSKSHAYLAIERNFNNLGNLYSADRVTFSAGHVFLEKIQTRLKGYYQIANYDSLTGLDDDGQLKDRKDHYYEVTGSVGYMFQPNLILTLEGGIENRDSNLFGRDYQNEFCLLKLEYEYDFSARGGYTDEGIYY